MYHALLLAGGPGSRLWPLSRRALPKPLLTAPGPRTLLDETVARLDGLVPPERCWVVAPEPMLARIRAHRSADDRLRWVAEPEARDTAPAVALGVAAVRAADPDAVVLICPADHRIHPVPRFQECARAAFERAEAAGSLVLMGIPARRPATEFGWIQLGPAVASGTAAPIHRVLRFREKPDAATADAWHRAGDHCWNSGLLAARAADLHARLAARAPLPRLSLDRLLLESAPDLEVVRATFEWDDLGSFASLAAALPQDEQGNVALGELLAHAAHGNLALTSGPPIVLLGVQDLVVVRTPELTLVCPRDRTEELRELLARLAREGRQDLL